MHLFILSMFFFFRTFCAVNLICYCNYELTIFVEAIFSSVRLNNSRACIKLMRIFIFCYSFEPEMPLASELDYWNEWRKEKKQQLLSLMTILFWMQWHLMHFFWGHEMVFLDQTFDFDVKISYLFLFLIFLFWFFNSLNLFIDIFTFQFVQFE